MRPHASTLHLQQETINLIGVALRGSEAER